MTVFQNPVFGKPIVRDPASGVEQHDRSSAYLYLYQNQLARDPCQRRGAT